MSKFTDTDFQCERISKTTNLIDQLIAIHTSAFPTHTLTKFGKPFLRELYNAFANRSNGILIVAIENNKVIGLAAGCHNPSSFFRDLRKERWFYFLIFAIPAIVKNPKLIIDKLHSAIAYNGAPPENNSEGTLLSSIAVQPSHHSKGVGQIMLKEFENITKEEKGKLIYLTTDTNNNSSVNSFYSKNGYTIESTFVLNKKRKMNRFVKKIP